MSITTSESLASQGEESDLEMGVLPFDFLEYLCGVRGIEPDTALLLLAEFLLDPGPSLDLGPDS
jgi:hypothetical protein